MSFDKDDSKIMKGIAILMMIFHHFLGFPSWWDSNVSVLYLTANGPAVVSAVADFCKICVGIFIFITGYSIHVKKESYKGLVSRAGKVLIFYWFCYALYLILGITINDPLPPLPLLLAQLFGLCTATGYNWDYIDYIHPVFAWYISVYLVFILSKPIWIKFCKKRPLAGFVTVYLLVNALYCSEMIIDQHLINIPLAVMRLTMLCAIYIPIGVMGYLFSENSVFQHTYDFVHRYIKGSGSVVTICSIFVAIIFALRAYTTSLFGFYETVAFAFSIDALFIVAFIMAVWLIRVSLKETPALSACDKVLLIFSAHSTSIWLMQGIFFTPERTFQSIVYWPHYPLLVFIATSVILLVIAVVTDSLYNLLVSRHHK